MTESDLLKLVQNRYLVVGSGPSAVAVCSKLIESGHKPIVFDTGIPQVTNHFEKNSEFKQINEENHVQKNKKWFGGLVPYLQWNESNLFSEKELNVCQSFGFGGFSRVWGGTFDYYDDYVGWPNSTQPITEDFEVINELVGYSKTSSESNQNTSSKKSIKGCSFSDSFYQKIENHEGLRVNKSTVAIEKNLRKKNSCELLGNCITGCAKDSIWFAGNQITEWITKNQIIYFPNFFLQKILGSSNNTKLIFQNKAETITIKNYKRVFIACGPLGTGAILIRSGIKDSIEIKDTATLFFGAFSLKKKAVLESHHSLSQWWVELTGSRNIRAQFYSPSKANLELLLEKYKLLRYFPRLQEAIILRLHPFICYVNSQDSDSLVMEKFENLIVVRQIKNQKQEKTVNRNLRKLSKNLWKAGLFIPTIFLKPTPPGSGFHLGSSMPQGIATDSWGRLSIWQNVHIVDASVLPTLEVGSITPTIMVNAARITREVIKLDSA